MENTNTLKGTIFQYAQRLPDGHPLKDIAITTIKELNRENPFDRNKPRVDVKEMRVAQIKTNKYYSTLEHACEMLDLPVSTVKYEVQQVLKKYGLRLG